MEKLQITKGEIIPKEIFNEKGTHLKVISMHGGTLGESICNITTRNEGRAIGNAHLICNSLNTYQQCETLPSELLRQNREMKEAIKTALSYFESCKDHWEEGESIVYHDLFNACNKGK